jgi:TRAP-type C4-dicarboxylate transport system permease small subunit
MKRFYEVLCSVEATLARTFLAIMVVLVFSAGLARMLGHPINWAIDVATCLFAWACLLSADVAWRNNRLMSVEVFTNFLSEQTKKYVNLINYAILIIFLIYIIPTGLWLSWVSRARAFQGIPDFSYSWVTMSMPVGGALLLVTTILKVRAEMRRLRGEG